MINRGALMMMISHGTRLVSPAHVFLLSRIAQGVVGYLAPFNPLPGYSKWLQNILSRGSANTEWNSGLSSGKNAPTSEENGAIPSDVAERFASELMPDGSTVIISRLQSGHGGAEVL